MTDPTTHDPLADEIRGLLDTETFGGMHVGDLLHRAEAALNDRLIDLVQCERTRTLMRRILDAVAVAVKGDAPPLTAHDWSDLPALVAALRADKERLDWLAEHGVAYGSAIEMNHGVQLYGATMRAAIDHARGAE